MKLVVVLLLSSLAFAQSGERAKDVERVSAAATVLDEIMTAPDKGIPEEILEDATCVAVVPSLKKAGFGFGGQWGRGVASCRTAAGWSAPAFFTIGGGSFGLQIGAQEVDLVMVVMNQKGMERMLESKFKLGADASAAAGPVGRHAEGMTDWKMRAEVLTYSRTRGLFAGLELNGAVIKQDKSSTRDFYGHMVPYKSILTGATPVPTDAQPLTGALAKYAKKPASSAPSGSH